MVRDEVDDIFPVMIGTAAENLPAFGTAAENIPLPVENHIGQRMRTSVISIRGSAFGFLTHIIAPEKPFPSLSKQLPRPGILRSNSGKGSDVILHSLCIDRKL
jgi:hypothetical protein